MSPKQYTNKIPQPKSIPILGNVHLLDTEKPVQSLIKLAKQYGEIFKMDMVGTPVIVVSSQKLVSEICNEDRFEKKLHRSLKEIRALGGDALFTAETKELNWEKAHRILMPVFGPSSIRDMFEGMLDIANQLFLKWERLGDGAVVDVADNMTRLTLDTIALTSFNYRFNSFYQNEMHPFVTAMADGLEEASRRTRRLKLVNQMWAKKKNKFAEDVQLMHQVSDSLIQERKRHPNMNPKKDLLDVMLNSKDPVTGECLDDQNIRYQMVTFLIAGHETTSGLLSFAMYELIKNPKILARARKEVDSVIGNRAPNVNDIAKFTYLDQILRETLRLWPTAPAFAVRSLKPHTTIGDHFDVTSEDGLLVLTPSLHRDPMVWKNPETFDPDRMHEENFAKIPPHAWKPFGNGIRSCIGRPFAMQEALLVLALAIQNFDFEFEDPHYELKIKETLTLKPNGLRIRIRKRNTKILHKETASQSKKTEQHTSDSTAQSHLNQLTPLLVLFGSNSGSSEGFARRIASESASHGYAPTLAHLDDYTGKLPRTGAVLIVTASYEGQPPDNAKKFVSWVKNLNPHELDGVQYAVFGCGNRDWSRTYQAIPKLIDALLEKSGAERIYPLGAADARADFFGDFDQWYFELWPKLGEKFGKPKYTSEFSHKAKLEVDFIEPVRKTLVRSQGLKFGKVIEVRELVNLSKPGARSKIHVELELPEGLTYQAGDYLSILGSNPPENVKRVLKRFTLDGDSQLVLKNSGLASALPVNQPIVTSELLANFVELAQPATKNQIQHLADSTACPPEKMGLLNLIENEATYQSQVLHKRISVLDLLEQYESCALQFGAFLQMLPPLKPRQYSISSSPLRNPRTCTLTVAVLKTKAFSGKGTFIGVTSTFLSHLRPGDWVPLLPKNSQQGFHLPDHPKTPIILACAGTGLAPFRGFLEERSIVQKMGKEIGEAILFFGCDHPEIDFLYRTELEELEREGVVKLRMAFSAQPENDVLFVQHRIWKDRAEVITLMSKGAKFFVCGDGLKMAPAVRKSLIDGYQDVNKVSAADANAWMNLLETESRFVQDVFGESQESPK